MSLITYCYSDSFFYFNWLCTFVELVQPDTARSDWFPHFPSSVHTLLLLFTLQKGWWHVHNNLSLLTLCILFLFINLMPSILLIQISCLLRSAHLLFLHLSLIVFHLPQHFLIFYKIILTFYIWFPPCKSFHLPFINISHVWPVSF